MFQTITTIISRIYGAYNVFIYFGCFLLILNLNGFKPWKKAAPMPGAPISFATPITSWSTL